MLLALASISYLSTSSISKNSNMKQFLAILLCSGSTLASAAQSDHDGFLYLKKDLSAEAINEVHVNTSGGGIEVTGVDGSQARIEVYISGNNGRNLSKEEIQSRLDEYYDLSVTAANHVLKAEAKNKRRMNDWKRAVNISFVVYVPVQVRTDLSTSGGGIALKNLSGREEFTTSGGGLSLTKVSGHINGRTSGGGIELTDCSQDIDLATSGGGIKASNCTGTIELNTSGGGLDLNDLSGTIHAETSGGGIEGENIKGELDTHTSGGNIRLTKMSSSLTASTSGGNIYAEILDPGKFVKLRNSGGRIDLTVPKGKGLDLKIDADKIHTDDLVNFSGSSKEDRLNGSVNGGGIPITADAGGGRVNLSFR